MPGPVRRRYVVPIILTASLTAAGLTACGDDKKDKSSTASKATTLSITTADAGKKRFSMQVPKSIEGGLVKITFTNASKVKHDAQLVRLDGGHTLDEALKITSGDKVVLPDWLHVEGGVASTPPGQTSTATVKLPAGDYGVIDDDSDNGPPPAAFGAKATFKVTGDNGGEITDTTAKIVAKDKGDDEFEWVTTNLKPGKNELTFDNASKEIHLVIAAPIVGKATLADVKKFLGEMNSSGPPPLGFDKAVGTSILDGKKKLTTSVNLPKGRTALICFLTDRDGKGKAHYEEGLLKEVDIK